MVATYGDRSWQQLAESRAVPSAMEQAPVIRVHGETLHGARNEGLDRVETPYVLFLDGDDELESGAVAALSAGTADLRVPSVRYVTPAQTLRPAMLLRVAGHRHDCTGDCLEDGNFMVVGTMARTELMRQVGGWEPWKFYEDWALWWRMWRAGASIECIPEAVYRAHVRRDSRNRAPSIEEKNAVHYEIVDAILGPVAEAA